jgi:hypothetical protein
MTGDNESLMSFQFSYVVSCCGRYTRSVMSYGAKRQPPAVECSVPPEPVDELDREFQPIPN